MHRNAASRGLRSKWLSGGRGGWEGVGLGSAREECMKVRGPPVAVSGASRRTAIGPPCATSRVLWGRFVKPHRTRLFFFL